MKLLFISLFFLILSSSVLAQDTIYREQPGLQDTIIEQPVEQPAEQILEQPAKQPKEQPVKPAAKPPMKDKFYFGGYVNFTVGSYTMIGIEPLVGYKLTPKLSAGIKIRYDYISDRRYTETYTTSNYGGSVFTRLRLLKQLYIHAEFAIYNYDLYVESGESGREWIPFLFVGAGYSQRIGKRSTLNMQILFDVLQNSNSPYRKWEPFYSIGYGVGF